MKKIDIVYPILISVIIAIISIFFIKVYKVSTFDEKPRYKPELSSQEVIEPEIQLIELPNKVATTENTKRVEFRIREIADQMDFEYPDYLVRLAFCESSLNPLAVGDSGKSRGLFQIHKNYHPNITDQEAFDIEFSTKWTIEQINLGKQSMWTCNEIAKIKN
jgi:hypothetical protein